MSIAAGSQRKDEGGEDISITEQLDIGFEDLYYTVRTGLFRRGNFQSFHATHCPNLLIFFTCLLLAPTKNSVIKYKLLQIKCFNFCSFFWILDSFLTISLNYNLFWLLCNISYVVVS